MRANRAGQTGSRLHRFAAWLSQGANLVLFNGSPDETVSGRAYRQGVLLGDKRWARARRIIDRVFFWDPDHCFNSHAQDLAFARHITGLYDRPKESV